MALSAVAGILDRRGGLRVVVTQRFRMRHHVGKGEQLFVVPGLAVQEPVPWDQIPLLIHRVHLYVNEKIAPHNACGGCFACCKIPFIRIDANSGGGTCHHCLSNGACGIYASRPKPCRDFKCLWLESQSRNDQMAPELRPDRCGVVFTHDTVGNDPLLFEVHRDPVRPDMVNDTIVRAYIDEMQHAGHKAKLITHYLPDGSE
jgi:hypothetical protein